MELKKPEKFTKKSPHIKKTLNLQSKTILSKSADNAIHIVKFKLF
jgi:hypothetical protein